MILSSIHRRGLAFIALTLIPSMVLFAQTVALFDKDDLADILLGMSEPQFPAPRLLDADWLLLCHGDPLISSA